MRAREPKRRLGKRCFPQQLVGRSLAVLLTCLSAVLSDAIVRTPLAAQDLEDLSEPEVLPAQHKSAETVSIAIEPLEASSLESGSVESELGEAMKSGSQEGEETFDEDQGNSAAVAHESDEAVEADVDSKEDEHTGAESADEKLPRELETVVIEPETIVVATQKNHSFVDVGPKAVVVTTPPRVLPQSLFVSAFKTTVKKISAATSHVVGNASSSSLPLIVLIGLLIMVLLTLSILVFTEMPNDIDDGGGYTGFSAGRQMPMNSAAQMPSSAKLPAQGYGPPTMQPANPERLSFSHLNRVDSSRVPRTLSMMSATSSQAGRPYSGMIPRSNSSAGMPSQSQLIGAPPPLCRELVLQHTEAWFCVAFKELESDNDSFDFFGLSGKALLRAQLQTSPSGASSLSICMKPPNSPVLGTISSSAPTPYGWPTFEIRDGKGALYGTLRGTGDMLFSLYFGEQEVKRLDFDHDTSMLHLRSTSNAAPMACASRCTDNDVFHNEEFLEVRVNPGVDAVLSLLCIIGSVVFSVHHGETLPVGAPPPHVHGTVY